MDQPKTQPIKTVEVILSEAQRWLVAPKSNRNNFGKYNYRSCEDILNAVKKVLPLDAAVLCSDELVMIGERYYIKATAKLVFNNESIEVTAYARESLVKKGMDESQITGTASSYARKYALNGLFAIDDTKDADTRDNRESHEETDPGQYKITIGTKYKGLKLQNIGNDELISLKAILRDEVDQGETDGRVKETLAAIEIYLDDSGAN